MSMPLIHVFWIGGTWIILMIGMPATKHEMHERWVRHQKEHIERLQLKAAYSKKRLSKYQAKIERIKRKMERADKTYEEKSKRSLLKK